MNITSCGSTRQAWTIAILQLIVATLLPAIPAGAQPGPATSGMEASTATAGPGRWSASALSERPWFDPVIADPRAPQVSVIAFGYSKAFDYMLQPGNRAIWDISLGKEIPIVVFESAAQGDAPIAPRTWGIGIWAPVNFHMVSDFKDPSNPIINTDYRFAGALKIAYGLSEEAKFGFRAQVGHESTHLGG